MRQVRIYFFPFLPLLFLLLLFSITLIFFHFYILLLLFSSDWLIVEVYNNRIHKIFMDNDSTSDICDNDIICAFEIRNNSNPLAIYLEYEGELIFATFW